MQSKTDRKICGTCEFWSGKREPVFDQNGNPKINIYDTNAICNKQDHRFADENRNCRLCCGRYSKWTEILQKEGIIVKKNVALTLIILTMCLLFTACKCEHQYEEKVTKEASCTAVGIKTFTCKECNESYTEEIPMLEHTYTSAVTKEPTCAEKGTTTFTCTVCDHSYTEEIEMVAHTLGEATITKEPTCIEEGEKVATCTVCSASGVSETIAKVEHSYTAKVTAEPTCTATGTKTLTCSGCGGTKTENVAQLGHNYTQTEIKKVTCTEDGTRRVSCSRCGDSYDEAVKSTGHNWKDATCTKAKYCTTCNQEDGSALGHTTDDGTCSRCGKVFSVADKCSLTTQNSIPCWLILSMYSNPDAPIIQMQITDVDYNFSAQGDGKVRLNLDFDVYISQAGFSTASFYVKLYDPAGRLIKNQHVYTEDTATGLYTTADTYFNNLEPGAYTIKLTAKS